MEQVVVNGMDVSVPGQELRYEDIVQLAGIPGEPTVTWCCRLAREGGSLLPGDSIAVMEGLVFNVVHTGSARPAEPHQPQVVPVTRRWEQAPGRGLVERAQPKQASISTYDDPNLDWLGKGS